MNLNEREWADYRSRESLRNGPLPKLWASVTTASSHSKWQAESIENVPQPLLSSRNSMPARLRGENNRCPDAVAFSSLDGLQGFQAVEGGVGNLKLHARGSIALSLGFRLPTA